MSKEHTKEQRIKRRQGYALKIAAAYYAPLLDDIENTEMFVLALKGDFEPQQVCRSQTAAERRMSDAMSIHLDLHWIMCHAVYDYGRKEDIEDRRKDYGRARKCGKEYLRHIAARYYPEELAIILRYMEQHHRESWWIDNRMFEGLVGTKQRPLTSWESLKAFFSKPKQITASKSGGLSVVPPRNN